MAVVAKKVKKPLINQEVGNLIRVPVVTFAAALKSTYYLECANKSISSFWNHIQISQPKESVANRSEMYSKCEQSASVFSTMTSRCCMVATGVCSFYSFVMVFFLLSVLKNNNNWIVKICSKKQHSMKVFCETGEAGRRVGNLSDASLPLL